MVYCPQCGADNPDTARFCDQCGTELFPVAPENPDPAPPTPAPPPPAVSSSGASAPVMAGPTRCPQCGAAVIPGEAFCENCGAPLLPTASPLASAAGTPGVPAPPASGVPPQPDYPPPQPVGAPPPPPPPAAAPPPPPHAATPPPPAAAPPPPPPAEPALGPTLAVPVTRTTLAPGKLLCKESDVELPLPDAALAVVGRADPVSNFYPDIDLSPYGALQGGVGRRHMQLQIQHNQVVIEDLDSTNGTALNGKRLVPRTPYAVQHGDELRLGTMVLHIHL